MDVKTNLKSHNNATLNCKSQLFLSGWSQCWIWYIFLWHFPYSTRPEKKAKLSWKAPTLLPKKLTKAPMRTGNFQPQFKVWIIWVLIQFCDFYYYFIFSFHFHFFHSSIFFAMIFFPIIIIIILYWILWFY